jgi:hypothetical protein
VGEITWHHRQSSALHQQERFAKGVRQFFNDHLFEFGCRYPDALLARPFVEVFADVIAVPSIALAGVRCDKRHSALVEYKLCEEVG